MQIINATPHAISIFAAAFADGVADGADREIITIHPSGSVIRISETEEESHLQLCCVPVTEVELGQCLINGRPLAEPVDDVWYIVSMPTAMVAGRKDFVYPYVQVRDQAGRVVGCKALARVWPVTSV